MGRLKKITFPTESGEFIYVPNRIIELLKKKTIITKQHVVGGKLIIEYQAKKGSTSGVMELYDMGPDTSKN